jgi:hypothetical protein
MIGSKTQEFWPLRSGALGRVKATATNETIATIAGAPCGSGRWHFNWSITWFMRALLGRATFEHVAIVDAVLPENLGSRCSKYQGTKNRFRLELRG